MEKQKIGFKDLRNDLKVLVVGGWIMLAIESIAILSGFITGVLGA